MIVIIDNYDSFTYNLYQIISTMVQPVKVYRNDKITVHQVFALNPSAIIISPGPGSPEDAGISIELIRALDGSIPLLGVCLGFQAIASAFDAKIIRSPIAMHGKEDNIYHHGQNIYRALSQPFRAGRYHSLMVEKKTLPPHLIVDAENDEGLTMGFHHMTKSIFGVQFHPESILTPEGPKLLEAFINYASSREAAGRHKRSIC